MTLTLPLWVLGMALAMPAPAQEHPHPVDAKAATAPLIHRSPSQRYQPLGDATEPADWRAANRRVHEAGGWRAYAREAAAAASAAPVHKH
jgi:hypothetical protein